MLVAGGIATGLAIGAPFLALLLWHEGPWSGFLWNLLFRVFFSLVCCVLLVESIKAAKGGRWKEVAKGLGVFAFFTVIISLFWLQFGRQLSLVVHLHRLPDGQVRALSVACHSTDDPDSIRQIVSDLRGAQWYSPDSHGWSDYADLTLSFADGHEEHFSLTEVLAEGRLVVRLNTENAGLAAIPHLSDSMQRAGLLKVASYPRYDNKGFYQAIVPPSVCRQGTR